jgi:hypothetical protein
MARLDKWLTELVELKEEIAALESNKKDLETKILTLLEADETTTIEWEHNGKLAKATAVYSSTLKIDEDGLKDALTPAQWRSVTQRVLDQRALEDKVARGQIDVSVVAKNTTEVPRKPFIKVTTKK